MTVHRVYTQLAQSGANPTNDGVVPRSPLQLALGAFFAPQLQGQLCLTVRPLSTFFRHIFALMIRV